MDAPRGAPPPREPSGASPGLPELPVGAQDSIAVVDGTYPFVITDVPNGEYRLFAGTDSDDDNFLCDAGEACGAYPTLDSPAFIPVNGDRDDLDFESGFRVNLTTNAARAGGTSTRGGFSVDKSDAAPPPEAR